MHALSHLGIGVLPFEQWACVFSNPEFSNKPGLICKAFAVWFPTMLDYLGKDFAHLEAYQVCHDDPDSQDCLRLIDQLRAHYSAVVSLTSKEEQWFLYDRRLQNVHGVISRFRSDRINKVKHYDGTQIVSEDLDAEVFGNAIRPLYQTMQQSQMDIRNRIVTSNEFVGLGEFYNNNLKIEKFVIPLAEKMGVLGS